MKAPLIMSVIPSNLYASRPLMCTAGIYQGWAAHSDSVVSFRPGGRSW
jgi:hypothetical protein